MSRKSDGPVGYKRGSGKGKCFPGSLTSIASILRGFLRARQLTLGTQGYGASSLFSLIPFPGPLSSMSRPIAVSALNVSLGRHPDHVSIRHLASYVQGALLEPQHLGG